MEILVIKMLSSPCDNLLHQLGIGKQGGEGVRDDQSSASRSPSLSLSLNKSSETISFIIGRQGEERARHR